jgi:hypothetical protein
MYKPVVARMKCHQLSVVFNTAKFLNTGAGLSATRAMQVFSIHDPSTITVPSVHYANTAAKQLE